MSSVFPAGSRKIGDSTELGWVLTKNNRRPHERSRSHVIDHIIDKLCRQQAFGIPSVPCDADADTLAAVQGAINQDNYGVGIILRLEDHIRPDPREGV